MEDSSPDRIYGKKKKNVCDSKKSRIFASPQNKVAAALGHRHLKIEWGIEPRSILPQNKDGSALSIVIFGLSSRTVRLVKLVRQPDFD